MKVADLQKMVAEKVTEIVKRKGVFYGSENKIETPVDEIMKSASKSEQVIEFQKRADDVLLLSTILGKHPTETKLYKSFRKWLDASSASELKKAMDTTTSGSGSQWIPTGFSNQLTDMLNLERMLVGAIPKLPMSQNPFTIPTKPSRSTAYKGVQNTAPTASNPGTGNATFTASKMITYVPISYEINEDAMIDMLPIVKQDLVESLAYSEEDCVLNGDTTSTHMDSDVTDATDVRKCYKGFRKLALANSWTIDLATFNADTIATMIAKMAKYGVRKNKLIWAAGPKVLSKLLTLRDAQNNAVVLTIDKMGQQATFVSGQQGVMFGAPLVAAEAARENLNASGVYDGSVTSKAGLYLAYLPGWKLGERGGITAETDRVIKTQTIDIVASKREDLQPVHDITTEPIVCMGYNIAV